MESSLTTALRSPAAAAAGDRFTELGKRNKRLISAFFLLILLVAVITGAIILLLIHQRNLKIQAKFKSKIKSDIEEYCDSESDCITTLSESIQLDNLDSTTSTTAPIRILRLSLQTAIHRISNNVHNSCPTLLRHSVSQLNSTVNALDNPDEESRMAMVDMVIGARDDLDRCLEAMTTESEREAAAAVKEVKLVVDYGVRFLSHMGA